MALVRPPFLAAALAALAVSLLAVTTVVSDRQPPVPAPTRAEPVGRVDPLDVLREWDRRRAAAWAAGDVRALAALYTRSSTAGRRDVAMLGSYRSRGLRVRGMSRQLLAVRVLRSEPGLLRVRVTDRLVGAVVVRAGAARELPRDAASTLVMTLRRVAGHWRMDQVTQPRVRRARPR